MTQKKKKCINVKRTDSLHPAELCQTSDEQPPNERRPTLPVMENRSAPTHSRGPTWDPEDRPLDEFVHHGRISHDSANTKCCATNVVRDGAVNQMSSSIALRSPSPERSLMMEHMPSPQWPCRSMTAGRNCAPMRSQMGRYLRTLVASRALAAAPSVPPPLRLTAH